MKKLFIIVCLSAVLFGCTTASDVSENATTRNTVDMPEEDFINTCTNPEDVALEPLPPIEGILECTQDADCAPLPACHPKRCINGMYLREFVAPSKCAEYMDECAAYKNSDCVCEESQCTNRKLL